MDLVSHEGKVTEKEGNQPPKSAPSLTVEEVRGPQYIKVGTDELAPCHGLLALRRGWKAVTLENVAHRLIAERIAKIGQGPHDAVIAPRAVLPGHPHHQVFNLWVNTGTAGRCTGLGTITLRSSELAIPGEDRVCLGHCRNRFKRLPTRVLANRSKRFAIAVREQQAPSDLLAEEMILRQQILIAPPELLVERIGDSPEPFFTVHLSVHPCHDFLHW
jgi:hypothetical protein